MTIAKMQQRRGTAAAWTSANPTLSAGEIGFETDTGRFKIGDGSTSWSNLKYAVHETLIITVGDETTTITTGTAKYTWRMPFAMTLTSIPRASLSTASSSGNPTFDINEAGTSILGANKLSIDANEKTSTTAATATTLADTTLADDAEMTIDIDTAGTGAKGVKIYLFGYRTP